MPTDLARQLEMNRVTWAALQEQGVTEDTELRLDFFFVAPGQHQAEALAQTLRARTEYDVEAGSFKQGLLGRETRAVKGTTQPAPVVVTAEPVATEPELDEDTWTVPSMWWRQTEPFRGRGPARRLRCSPMERFPGCL